MPALFFYKIKRKAAKFRDKVDVTCDEKYNRKGIKFCCHLAWLQFAKIVNLIIAQIQIKSMDFLKV